MEKYTIEEYTYKALEDNSNRLQKVLSGLKFRVDVSQQFRTLLKQLEVVKFRALVNEVTEKFGDITLFERILDNELNSKMKKYGRVDYEKAFIVSLYLYAINLRFKLKGNFKIVEPIYLNNLVFNEVPGYKLSKRKKLSLKDINVKLKEIEEVFNNPDGHGLFALSHLRLSTYFWHLCAAKSIINKYSDNLFFLKFLISSEARLELYIQSHFDEDEQIEFLAQSKGGKAKAKKLKESRDQIFQKIKGLWDTGKWDKVTTFASDIHDLEEISLPYSTVYNFTRKYKKMKSASTI
ncbi:hypothetical protein JUNP543_1080 [Acinetobacter baumannii]|nr:MULTISPECIES: hypothetical protein [Acinetobacter calcoaceticus/baumannii complex]KMV03172.1 hypothetical protein AB994_1915 [Acinetobacter baumannii]MCK0868659.1 hypothetical protein [Acinetobacter pittii]MDH2524614.1 hypothetical protein [Acinetobacter baumannii]MEE1860149.1 hypothetical protein [Acinetobacter baumannii]OZT31279.1 hypothetical protein CHQ89_03580 [Acinetobacter baumannii]